MYNIATMNASSLYHHLSPTITSIIILVVVLNLSRTGRCFECNQSILDKSFVTQCKPSQCEPLLDGGGQNARADNDESPGQNIEPSLRPTPPEWPTSQDEVVQIVSTRAGDRFKVLRHKSMNTMEYFYEESHVNVTMFVKPDVKYQRILGFGTTLTDAACTNVDGLPVDIRQKLIDDCFSVEKGIALNLLKIPIGSTKYSFTNYALDQPDDDNHIELSAYDIDHRIPLIKDAMTTAGKMKNRIKLLASAATAPPSCKQNNRLIHGGYLREDKIEDYASHLLGFAQAYKERGLNIWSLILSESPVTVARDKEVNETLDYNSMAMRPSDSKRLIKAIGDVRSRQNAVARDQQVLRLLLLGDDRAHIPVWVDGILGDPNLSSKISGIAYNCKQSEVTSYDNLVYANKRFPSKYLISTSGSINAPMRLGDWQYAENYATEIVKNLEYGSVGWIESNLALNLQGGPAISPRFNGELHRL